MIPSIEVKVSQLAPNNLELKDASFAPLEDDMGAIILYNEQVP